MKEYAIFKFLINRKDRIFIIEKRTGIISKIFFMIFFIITLISIFFLLYQNITNDFVVTIIVVIVFVFIDIQIVINLFDRSSIIFNLKEKKIAFKNKLFFKSTSSSILFDEIKKYIINKTKTYKNDIGDVYNFNFHLLDNDDNSIYCCSSKELEKIYDVVFFISNITQIEIDDYTFKENVKISKGTRRLK